MTPARLLRTSRARRRRAAALILAAALGLSVAAGTALAAQAGGALYRMRVQLETLTLPGGAGARAAAEVRRLESRLDEASKATAAGDLGAARAALAAYEDILSEATSDGAIGCRRRSHGHPRFRRPPQPGGAPGTRGAAAGRRAGRDPASARQRHRAQHPGHPAAPRDGRQRRARWRRHEQRERERERGRRWPRADEGADRNGRPPEPTAAATPAPTPAATTPPHPTQKPKPTERPPKTPKPTPVEHKTPDPGPKSSGHAQQSGG